MLVHGSSVGPGMVSVVKNWQSVVVTNCPVLVGVGVVSGMKLLIDSDKLGMEESDELKASGEVKMSDKLVVSNGSAIVMRLLRT